MPAPPPRPVPLPSPLGVAAALVAGAGLALAAVVLSSGSVAWGGIGWAMAAGAFACASGLVLGTAGRALPAGALGLVAVASLVAAGAASAGDDGRRAEFPARADLAADSHESADGGAAQPHATGDRDAAQPHASGDRDAAQPHASGDRDATGPREGDGREARASAGRPAVRGERRPSLARVVRAYYAALDRGDYARAWARLSPDVRASFGGFAAWRAGYASTSGHELEDLEVDGDEVRIVIAAVDRAVCDATRRFAVTWRLEGGTATAVSARALAGPASC